MGGFFGKTGAGDGLGLDVKDYLHLLKLLHINLPEGVLSPEVIQLSKAQTCISDAQSIVTELEDFKIQFCRTPRLGCREVKRTLALKNSGNVLQITKTIFFNAAQKTESLNEIWKKNSRNTDRGFRMRDMYKYKPISTPKMDSTATKRTLNTEPKVTKGKSVEKNYLEDSEEPRLNEMECLKFYHELKMKNSGKKVQYTRGNTVEYSFLSGRLDFLAHLQQERLVIECKGTTGDMVGKVFTKTQSDDHLADLVETHGYFFQTQAYMYILNQDNKLLSRPLSNRAVMVIRHYHKDDNSPQDFYWNELQLDEKIQTDIDELRTYCQREVLACFLAMLDLIFQKEIT